MDATVFIRDLAILLGAGGLVSWAFQKIRQPVVVGYIIAGFFLGPHFLPFPVIHDNKHVQVWGQLGVIFLMFSLGLEFSFRKLTKVGISASITAIFEVSAMAVLGFFTGKLLGWSFMDRVFLGAMIAISSTTIIVKTLDELQLKTRRFAQMIFAILVVEDLMAILMLVSLTTLAISRTVSGWAVLLSALQLILVLGGWFLTGYFVVPRFIKNVGKIGSDEILTLLALGLCLFLAVEAANFHYSVALGAFIMGSILAESTESHRIERRLESIRDLFAAIFFISVGMLLNPSAIQNHIGAILLIALVTITGKIVSNTVMAVLTGQTFRTAIQVGFGLAQIGEFSFIIAGLGLTLGVVNSFIYPVAIAVALITTLINPYLVRISHQLAVSLENKLPLRAKTLLVRYAVWTQQRRADNVRKQEFYRRFLSWALNGIIVSIIFILSGQVLLPFILRRVPDYFVANVIAWLAALILSSPFLWGMFSAFQGFVIGKPGQHDIPRGGTLFITRVLTVFLTGMLSINFFPAKYAVFVSAIIAAILFLTFHQQLGASYRWFEKRFLSTFENEPKTPRRTDVLRGLAPWDAHLVRIKVHPNADIAGKKIVDAGLRNRYGLNIVVIQRGLRTIVAPKPQELIFPKDELLVLGTDEQIEAIRPEIERPPGLEHRFMHISGYELRQLWVSDESPLVKQTIRCSGFRERFNAMVVGIERQGNRIINPDSEMIFRPGDIIWLVGETTQLDQLMNEFGKEKSPARETPGQGSTDSNTP